jgi:hypothetical protein
MGIRINTSIGYGISVADINLHTTIKCPPGGNPLDGFTDLLEKSGVLYNTVCDVDFDTIMLLIYPTDSNYASWYRHDDTIDYDHALWAGGYVQGACQGMKCTINEVPLGPYPYNNLLMDIDGKSVDWNDYDTSKDNPDIFPRMPPVLLKLLEQTGALDHEGLLKIRPQHATWWS